MIAPGAISPFNRAVFGDAGNQDPSDIFGANLIGWYDAAATDYKTGAAQDYFTLSGSNIQQWDDRSGGSRHLKQDSSSNQPIKGTELVQFDKATSDYFIGDGDYFNFGNGSTDSPFSVFALVNIVDMTNCSIFDRYISPNLEWALLFSATDLFSIFIYDESASALRGRRYNTALTAQQGNWIRIGHSYDGRGGSNAQDGCKLYYQGSRVDDLDVSSGTYTAMEDVLSAPHVGLFNPSSPVYSDMSARELLVIDSEITTEQQAQLDTYFTAKWSL